MDAEYLSFDDCSERKVVESVSKVVPNVVVAVLFGHLVVEAVDGRNVPGLVVASQQYHQFGVLQFVQEQQQDGLD